MIDNITNYEISTMDCFACKKPISKINDCKLNLNGYEYHYNCFKCNSCSTQLYFNSLPTNLPFMDKNGILYCITHYLQSIKCKLCFKNFTTQSNIHNIGNENDDDYLAHTECLKCLACDDIINISNQFYYDENKNSIKCKNCCQSMLNLPEDSKLTMEQREAIIFRFFKKNQISDEANDFDFIQEFATKNNIKTQVLINYLNNCIDIIKKPTKNDEINKETKVAELSDNIIQQITKLDKTLAPNKNPFI